MPAWAPWVAAGVPTALLAAIATRGVLESAGHASVPLDDAYIHFQYARRLAEGHFFSYTPGAGYSSGATSLLWPALLAPFWGLGLRGTSIAWAAWLFGWAALAALAVETWRLATRLAGRGPALGAAAMVLAFGGHAWCAASGMEVVPLAWLLARTARVAAEWGEEPALRTARRRGELVLLAIAAALLRPEGALAALVAAGALAIFPAAGAAPAWRARLWALAPLAGPLVPPLVNLALTGRAASATTMVKWLPVNPYDADRAVLWKAVRENLRLFFDVILDGREWSAVFVPTGARPLAIAALVALPLAGVPRGRRWRALLVTLCALAMLGTTTYLSFLWNRLRYLWPFAFAWFVGLACLARAVGDLAASVHPRFARAGTLIAAGFAGLLAGQMRWSLDDLADSAAAIDRQQATLGRWAAAHLPERARIGVNDTGAIAYFSGRSTFDVVGLTTPSEARYWVAGAGSRYEHYERLGRSAPDVLPTHFIVYPEWFACEPVLGRELAREEVEATILGGRTMIAYEADWKVLGRADAPVEPPPGELVDEVDVADLESEAEHAYVIGSAAKDVDDIVVTRPGDDDRPKLADGARARRTFDELVAKLPPGRAITMVARTISGTGASIAVRVGEVEAPRIELPPTAWNESRVELPAGAASGATRIRLDATRGSFGSAHYWFYAR